MTPQATNRREGGLTSCHSRSRKFALAPHLERAREREGRSETAWCAAYWECPGRGFWWQELKEANKPPIYQKYMKTV